MFLNLWRRIVNQYLRTSRRAPPPFSRPKAASFRPQLEAFEDRTLLSTVYWVGGAGLWSEFSHWLDSTTLDFHVPTASDDAVIASGVTVTHSGGTDAVRSVRVRTTFLAAPSC
jgi:hypothetical protein